MEIIYRKIETLKKLDNNPRTISEEQMRILKESIIVIRTTSKHVPSYSLTGLGNW